MQPKDSTTTTARVAINTNFLNAITYTYLTCYPTYAYLNCTVIYRLVINWGKICIKQFPLILQYLPKLDKYLGKSYKMAKE